MFFCCFFISTLFCIAIRIGDSFFCFFLLSIGLDHHPLSLPSTTLLHTSVRHRARSEVMFVIHIPQRKSILVFYSLLILLFGPSFIVFAQSCYFPNGVLAPNFTPCDGTARVSHCCKNAEACLTSGLCYGSDDHSINIGTCTDENWNDSNCFQSCPRTSGELIITKSWLRCCLKTSKSMMSICDKRITSMSSLN